MEFIKNMKKREFIEMGLKTLAAILAAFLAIILMEGMIYGIELNALKTKGEVSILQGGSTVAYCIEEKNDQYFVLYYNEGSEKEWSATKNTFLTKEQCEALKAKNVEVKYNAPNAFEFSITPVHFIVMAIFILAVGGFFTYKFIALSKEYKKIEDNFNKTGTIELG